MSVEKLHEKHINVGKEKKASKNLKFMREQLVWYKQLSTQL